MPHLKYGLLNTTKLQVLIETEIRGHLIYKYDRDVWVMKKRKKPSKQRLPYVFGLS
ncbi:MAG TPA: hypothetical protein VF884_03375 [Nitrososphaeraceae archaeon]